MYHNNHDKEKQRSSIGFTEVVGVVLQSTTGI